MTLVMKKTKKLKMKRVNGKVLLVVMKKPVMGGDIGKTNGKVQ